MFSDATAVSPHSRTTFGPTYTIDPAPQHAHTHTIIFLHGRGSTGGEFAQELFESFSENSTEHFRQRLPTWRWVFPSSCSTYNATFQEDMPSWFDAPSLSDPSAGQEEQMPGLRSSVKHVQAIISDEAKKLDGQMQEIFLGGISQGGAVAMWTILNMGLQDDGKGGRLGGLVIANAWLPFASEVQRLTSDSSSVTTSHPTSDEPDQRDNEQIQSAEAFVEAMLAVPLHRLTREATGRGKPTIKGIGMPLFFGHGTDDAYVDVTLGRQAHDVFRTLPRGYDNGTVGLVQWREYTGADQEGHWLNVPEEANDIIDFLVQHSECE